MYKLNYNIKNGTYSLSSNDLKLNIDIDLDLNLGNFAFSAFKLDLSSFFNINEFVPLYSSCKDSFEYLRFLSVDFLKLKYYYIPTHLYSPIDFTFTPRLLEVNNFSINLCAFIIFLIMRYKPIIFIFGFLGFSYMSNILADAFNNVMCLIYSKYIDENRKGLIENEHNNNMHLYILLLTIFILLIIHFNLFYLFNIILLIYFIINCNCLSMLVYFSYLIIGVSAHGLDIAQIHNGSMILNTLGLVSYIFFSTLYDYFLIRKLLSDKSRHRPVIKSAVLNHIVTGFIFLLAMNTGIFSTNSVWYTTNTNNNGFGFTLTLFLTIFASGYWNVIKHLVNSNDIQLWQLSLIRSIFECISFTSICWNTFFTYRWFVNLNIPHFEPLAIVVGFILHLIFSYLQIFLETRNCNSLLSIIAYGLCYFISFTGLVFWSNALIGIANYNLSGLEVQLPVSILNSIIVVLLHPNYYRKIEGPNWFIDLFGKSNIHIEVISFIVLFFSYVILNSFLYSPFTGI